MPQYDLELIRGAIKTILESVTELAFVYDRRNPNPEGYPCAIMDITNNTNKALTNTENERTIHFEIRLLQEVGVQGASEANRILDVATKKVVEALESKDNISLGGLVDFIMPTAGNREEPPSTQGSVIWQVLGVDVRVATSIE